MPLIRPFAGLRPVPERAHEVVAPPYDVLNSAEARQRAAGRPWSFLHISKAEIDLPEDTDPYAAAVYAKAAENLEKMISAGVLKRDSKPCYYVYRLSMGDHVQTGLVAAASVADYDSNRIRKHEFTRPAKEDDRVRQIEALNAQTGPVLLAYRSDPVVDGLIDAVTVGAPEYDLTADDEIRHTLWVVSDESVIERLSSEFDRMNALYIADGHHRSAAASRVASKLNGGPEAMSSYFLSVIFPHKQMQILDYNRVVRDLNGLSATVLLEKIAAAFDVEGQNEPVAPARAGEFGMYLDGRWYRLSIHAERVPDDPVARLDVSVLAENLLEPLLGISDPRRDPRIDFVGGIRGLGELEKRVDSGEMAVAFSLFPTSMEDLMAVADANQVMPPKSTWFEPKLADGLVSHVLD
ncbi:MAG: DUF1015 domain-containing protein [Gammaproteobacteria bacterium]|nr:MAG: DUF1015 domain-containing protein [Gammaproteobacteria bacterium]